MAEKDKKVRTCVILCVICQKPIPDKEIKNGKDNVPVCSERCQKDSWGDVNL